MPGSASALCSPPLPRANESENDFTSRAHQELLESCPNTDERNALIFEAWRDSRGETELERKAHSKFSDTEFIHQRDVPVFAEHSYVDRQGQTQRYDREALQAICDRCNHRIADTGNFAVISEGHTPTQEQIASGAKMPPALGFAGPYRLGMIGNRNPRWAIFADEHYFRSEADKLRRLPTRSPEVWLAANMAERFMDPIAALGSETPRLDMGIRFARLESGEQVEKYSACAPGAMSVGVPSEVTIPGSGKRKAKYGEEAGIPSGNSAGADNSAPPANEKGTTTMALSPEDIKQIVDAVMSTDAMVWVKAKMLADSQDDDDRDADDANGEPDGDESAAPATPAPVPTDPTRDTTPAAPPAAPSEGAEPPVDPEKDKMKPQSQPYSKIDEKARYAKLEAENAALAARVAAIETEKVTAVRYSKLQELRQQYAFDLDKEKGRCSGMTEQQFVDHLECIVENYQRIPVGASLYVPESLPVPAAKAAEQERYALDRKNRAMELVQQKRAAGDHGYSYEQALREAAGEQSVASGAKVA